ncbi:MAG: HD domain-containing phosphohydrolase [Suilimivivens sp.]
MIAYYLITAVLTFINLMIFIFSFDKKRISAYFTFMALLMVLANGGYLALALSTNLQEAVLANKIIYLGGCFVPPILLISICVICNYKVADWLRIVIYTYSFLVYAMVLTIGHNHLYYSEIFLDKFGNSTVLGHEYGIGHNCFYVIVYGYIVVEIFLLIYSLKKTHAVPRKSLYAMIFMETINCVLFVFGRKINPAFEIMPFMYVIDGWILLYMQRRAMLYNIEDCVVSSLRKQETYGYIVFDNHENYLGCNSVARKIFPEISECKVDLPVKNVPKVEEILGWIREYDKGHEEFSYENGDSHYQCNIERIWYKEKAYGYIVEMQDDTDRWNYMNLLSSYNAELEDQVKEKTEHIVNIQSQVLLGMANMVENRDGNTGGHIKRTSDVIKILVNTIQENNMLPLEITFFEDIIKAAPMHDLGKIGIDDRILKKPGKLTNEEFAIMQTHAQKSAVLVESILKGVEEEHFVKVAINVAKHHHEKWNGTGYPGHLKGEAIPIEARIMAIADVYDALVSKRCYKEAMSFEQAFEIMEKSMGSHFDPKLEPVFLLSREKLENYYKNAV